MKSRTVEVSILKNGSMCAVPVPFDPTSVFGRVRAPVRVTINDYTFRSTIARMGGATFIPLREENREAASVRGGDRVTVKIESDDEPRRVELPRDLARALKTDPALWTKWQELSYTHQKESVNSVDSAKRPETRERRIAKVVGFVAAKPAKKRRP